MASFMSATVIEAPILVCEHSSRTGASIALRGDTDYMTASSVLRRNDRTRDSETVYGRADHLAQDPVRVDSGGPGR